jgi:hypothetical protein
MADIGYCTFLFMYVFQDCFICRPSDSTVLEESGIEQDCCDFVVDSQTL